MNLATFLAIVCLVVFAIVYIARIYNNECEKSTWLLSLVLGGLFAGGMIFGSMLP